jgi:hypothetical protein
MFDKKWEISLLAEQLLVSQEGLSSIELVICHVLS